MRSGSDPQQAQERAHSRSTVQSLAKGFRILEAFGPDHDEMTLSEIAAIAELDPGTTHRMLNTMVDLGYIDRVPDSRRFRLSLKVLDLGFHAIAHRELRSLARPALRTLVNDTSEAASLGVLSGAEVLYIERVRAGVTRLGVDIRIGTTVPAHQSIIGHCILAFLPETELARLATLPRRQTFVTRNPIEWNDLGPALAEIRMSGHALRDSTLSEGLRILAVPVRDADGLAIGAISVAAPVGRSTEDEFLTLALAPAQTAARNIARALEASGSIGTSI
ncbi:IclR family transcriptional regulator [Microvirga tunisiensis]|uniref:IclR family transcriptional regulator n=2 Tax=Hyphomicrobiales TaxID=356 RepID=A0A5N7MTQ1_9HYPH|nr:IclR family transcriptional regulator [Microvirga tunisiensis]MPR12461.1 IclR family transcriptional regulator [Microvirga tunisiensis]MPR30372.1 IclR family transcriptional regulator [Microvirga tunisiensis]